MSMNRQARIAALIEHGYALIDQPRADLDRYSWCASLPLEVIKHTHAMGDLRLMPFLLRIDPKAPWLEALAENLEEDDPILACLLKCPAGEGQLMHQLVNRIIVHIPFNRSVIILRLYDSLVFQNLLTFLKPGHLASLFGPIEAISFPFQGELITHTPPEVPPGEHIPAFWTLDPDQLRRAYNTKDIAKVINWFQWEYEIKHWSHYDDWAATVNRISQAMEYALHRYGLHGTGDQQAFARHTLQYGEHFHLHTRMQDLIDALPLRTEAPGGRRGYRDAVFSLSKTDWAAIAAPLY